MIIIVGGIVILSTATYFMMRGTTATSGTEMKSRLSKATEMINVEIMNLGRAEARFGTKKWFNSSTPLASVLTISNSNTTDEKSAVLLFNKTNLSDYNIDTGSAVFAQNISGEIVLLDYSSTDGFLRVETPVMSAGGSAELIIFYNNTSAPIPLADVNYTVESVSSGNIGEVSMDPTPPPVLEIPDTAPPTLSTFNVTYDNINSITSWDDRKITLELPVSDGTEIQSIEWRVVGGSTTDFRPADNFLDVVSVGNDLLVVGARPENGDYGTGSTSAVIEVYPKQEGTYVLEIKVTDSYGNTEIFSDTVVINDVGSSPCDLSGTYTPNPDPWKFAGANTKLTGYTPEYSRHPTKTFKRLWTYSLNTYSQISPAMADIDGDGLAEVVANSNENITYAINRTGGLVWIYENNATSFGFITVEEINGSSPGKEIIFPASPDIYVLSSTGQLQANISGNRTLEVTAAEIDSGSPGIELLYKDPVSLQLRVLSSSLTELWNYPTDASYSPVGVADVNQSNPGLEIFFGTQDNVTLLDSSGNMLWFFETNYTVSCVAAEDISPANPGLELLFAPFDANLYVVDSSGNEVWKYYLGGNVAVCPSVGDLNRDGKMEIVAADMAGYVHVIDSEGVELWNHSIDPTFDASTSPVLADITGEGYLEIIAGYAYEGGGYGAGGGSNGALVILDRNGNELYRDSQVSVYYTVPAVGDMTGNGNLEIVLANGAAPEIIVYTADTACGNYLS